MENLKDGEISANVVEDVEVKSEDDVTAVMIAMRILLEEETPTEPGYGHGV